MRRVSEYWKSAKIYIAFLASLNLFSCGKDAGEDHMLKVSDEYILSDSACQKLACTRDSLTKEILHADGQSITQLRLRIENVNKEISHCSNNFKRQIGWCGAY